MKVPGRKSSAVRRQRGGNGLVPTLGRFETEEGKTKPQEEKSGDARRCGEALSLVSKRRRGTHGNGYLLSLPGLSLALSFPLGSSVSPAQASRLLPLFHPLSLARFSAASR